MAVIVLAIRRRWRLAVYLLVTGAGALTLDPVLKALVGRLRPVVAHPIAYGNGDSFPSGHALGSIVCYGALFLVFLPAVRGMWRRMSAPGPAPPEGRRPQLRDRIRRPRVRERGRAAKDGLIWPA